MATFIDFHALQTLPPSNINRGEDGAPKTAAFGGTRRQRISSQALKLPMSTVILMLISLICAR